LLKSTNIAQKDISMNALQNADQSVVLMKAFNNTCVALGFENTETSKLLGG